MHGKGINAGEWQRQTTDLPTLIGDQPTVAADGSGYGYLQTRPDGVA